jgi:glycosyltransferase involved in cell wall biosynthesis
MKILFCSQNPLDIRLGAAKVLMEVAATMETMGWRCQLASNTDIYPESRGEDTIRATSRFVRAMARFVEKHAREFDVIDYDQTVLPFPRRRFDPSTLLVARSCLLNYYMQTVRLPRSGGARAVASMMLRAPRRAARRRFNVWLSGRTFRSADLINVSNDSDRPELVARGFDERKIVVVPYGITEARLATFPAAVPAAPATPRVAFIGTFEPRKGATEFPEIVRHVTAAVPGCKFRLLGSRYLGEAQVLERFPRDLRGHIEVTPTYEPEALPGLLRDCSLGVFPSHYEGFGFAVVEMLAASLPVLAYDVPGPAMILGREWLVPRGSARELAARAVDLLTDPAKLGDARVRARARANHFTWERAARLTSDAYSEGVEQLRRGGLPRPARA